MRSILQLNSNVDHDVAALIFCPGHVETPGLGRNADHLNDVGSWQRDV